MKEHLREVISEVEEIFARRGILKPV